MSDLTAALFDLAPDGEPLRWAVGTVTDVSPFTVQINGDTTDIVSPPRCSSYTPTLSDIVLVLRTGAGFLVLDQIV